MDSIRGYLRFIERWWWLLLLGPILLAVPTYFETKRMTPTYQAKTIIFVNQTAQPDIISYNDSLLSQQLVKTYVEIALQPVVLDEASHLLGYPISGGIAAQPVRDTQLFQISATSSDPVRARDIADAVASVFIRRQAADLPANQVPTGLQVVQPALIPTHPVRPKLSLNLMAAAAIGLALSFGLAKLLDYLDDTITSSEDLEQAAGLQLLGTVDFLTGDGQRRRDNLPPEVLCHDTGFGTDLIPSLRQEAYRRIRATLDFALSRRGSNDPSVPFRKDVCEIVLVASANPREGRSTTVANLATVMAQANKRVIIIDADLRHPIQHHIFGLTNVKGLSNLFLDGGVDLDRYILPTQVECLHVLPSGPVLSGSVSVLVSALLDSLLALLRMRADIILIDSPAVLASSDTLEIAKYVDGTILVVDATRTRAPQLRAAMEELNRSGTHVLGAILNRYGSRRLDTVRNILSMRPKFHRDNNFSPERSRDHVVTETVASHEQQQ